MPETYTQVHMFCGLVGHYRCFIKGFAHIARPLYDVLGKEVKMGPVQLPLEAWEVVRILKNKIQMAPVLVFPNFDKPFLLKTDASKEWLGVVHSQKQDDGCYQPIIIGSHSLNPVEKNYHSLKLEFLALKWTYILTTSNLDAMGHRWVGALASFEFSSEYQREWTMELLTP